MVESYDYEVLNDILRLSGRSEYKGESTGKGAGTEYKG